MNDPAIQQAVRITMAVVFLLVGLSHLAQPLLWVRVFKHLHAMGRCGNTINAMLTLVPGLVIVIFHQVWRGVPMILTIIGWLYLIKSAVYLAMPSIGLASISRVDASRHRELRIAGVVLIFVAFMLLAHDFVLTRTDHQ